jgi:hypothetical protein
MSHARRQIFAAIMEYEGIDSAAKLDLINAIAEIFDDILEQVTWDLAQPKEPNLVAKLAREYAARYRKKTEPEAAPEPDPAPAAAGES